MKTKILSLSIIFAMAGILMTSCGDDSKKKAEKAEKEMVEMERQIEHKAQEMRAEARTDWEKFKIDSDAALAKRELEIKNLREEIAKTDKKQRAKLNKDLDELEQKNKDLKEKIEIRTNNVKDDLSDFNDRVIEDHRAARQQLKRDMDELGDAISNFFKKKND